MLASTGWAADTSEEDEDAESTSDELAALRQGANSAGCRRSPGFAQNGKPYMPVLDGSGTLMGKSTKTKVLLDGFVDNASLRARVGEVNAHGAGLSKMACYEIASG